MGNDKIGIWGPKVPQASASTSPSKGTEDPQASTDTSVPARGPAEAQTTPTSTAFQGHSPQQMTNHQTTRPIKRIRFGLPDALWGMLFLLLSQVGVAFGIVMFHMAREISAGLELDNPETMAAELVGEILTGPAILISSITMYLVWWLSSRIASKKRGLGSYVKDFWMKFRWKRDLLIGLGFALVFRVVELVLMNFVIGGLFDVDLTDAGNSSFIFDLNTVWIIIIGIGIAGLVGPFFEEFFFRGLFLQGTMHTFRRTRVRKEGKMTWGYRNRAWLAVVISSVVFGMMHFQGDFSSPGHWIVVGVTGTLGAALAVMTLKTKRLGPAIIAHIAFNLSGISLALALGDSVETSEAFLGVFSLLS